MGEGSTCAAEKEDDRLLGNACMAFPLSLMFHMLVRRAVASPWYRTQQVCNRCGDGSNCPYIPQHPGHRQTCSCYQTIQDAVFATSLQEYVQQCCRSIIISRPGGKTLGLCATAVHKRPCWSDPASLARFHHRSAVAATEHCTWPQDLR